MVVSEMTNQVMSSLFHHSSSYFLSSSDLFSHSGFSASFLSSASLSRFAIRPLHSTL